MRAIFPEGAKPAADQLKLSPAVWSGQHVFLTGITGSLADGSMPEHPEAQFRSAFDKISQALNAADLSCAAIVEMTSYHIGLREHFDLFNQVRLSYVTAPFPAWTAVEVAGLRREGALVEIRVIAEASP